jgi:DNA-binding response OmpR family regulator
MERKVLTVSPDAGVHRTVADTLTAHGYAVSSAFSGAEALETAEAGRPDIIVLTDKLPDMSGFQVMQARRPRADVECEAVVFLVSVEDEDFQPGFGFWNGPLDCVLRMPLDSAYLLSYVRRITRLLEEHSS